MSSDRRNAPPRRRGRTSVSGQAAVQPALVLRPEDCPRLIAVAEQLGQAASVPLLRAAAGGLVTVIEHGRGTCVSRASLDAKRKPVVVVLGDDDYRSTGPRGWPQAERLLRWARVIILHGASAEPVHYGMALAGALVRHRMLFVETTSANLEAWKGLARAVASPKAHVTVVAMAPGLVHPRQGAPAGASLQ